MVKFTEPVLKKGILQVSYYRLKIGYKPLPMHYNNNYNADIAVLSHSKRLFNQDFKYCTSF